MKVQVVFKCVVLFSLSSLMIYIFKTTLCKKVYYIYEKDDEVVSGPEEVNVDSQHGLSSHMDIADVKSRNKAGVKTMGATAKSFQTNPDVKLPTTLITKAKEWKKSTSSPLSLDPGFSQKLLSSSMKPIRIASIMTVKPPLEKKRKGTLESDKVHEITKADILAKLHELQNDNNLNTDFCRKDDIKLISKNIDYPINLKEISSYMETHCVNKSATLPACVDTWVGRLKVRREKISFEELYKTEINFVRPGGWWSPKVCSEKHMTAVIVPFRERYEHLPKLLRQLHPILKRQNLHYRIFVIEQDDKSKFNRGKLLNVGFMEVMKLFPYSCVVFHDVDLIPEDDRISYGCKHSPMHLSAAVDKWQYRLPYGAIFGGVEMFLAKDFNKTNGFPNLFYHWGGEDDIMHNRIRGVGMSLHRQSMEIARYTMLSHTPVTQTRTKADDAHTALLMRTTNSHQFEDGLNTCQYRVKGVIEHPLYTMIKVDLQKEKEYTFGLVKI